MSIERARNHLSQFGLESRILELDLSSATVDLAAAALGCEPARIAKTLSFHVGDKVVLVVCAGDVKVDNAKFKHQFGTKPKMLKAGEVEPLVGHAIGGVCPFGVNEAVETYLDTSLQRFSTVYPACGSSNSAIKLEIPELEKASNSLGWISVTK